MINITQTEKAKVYVTGSALFFSCYEDFIPHDLDLTTILSKNDIRLHGQLLLRIILFDNVELFAWRKMTPAEYIQELKIKMVGNAFRGALCSFFNPNFCREINFTIEDLKELKFMADEMDPKHAYLSMIYNYYIENNKMELTQEQRDTAYAEYKRERSDLNSLRY